MSFLPLLSLSLLSSHKHSAILSLPQAHIHLTADRYTIRYNMATNGIQETKEPIPDQKTLQEAGQLEIKDKDGNKVPFHSLFTDKPADQRQLIIFIRHFFCGVSVAMQPF